MSSRRAQLRVSVTGFVPAIPPSEKAVKKFNNYAPGNGMKVLKFAAGGGRPAERAFKISDDGRHLEYTQGWSKLWYKKSIPFEDILSIQPGQNVSHFHLFPEYKPSRMTSFSIQYKMGKGNVKHLALICVDSDQYGYFFGTILGILDKIAAMREETSMDRQYLQRLWSEADIDGGGTLTFSEIKRLLATLNIDLPAKAIEAKFKKVDLDNSNSLDFNEFVYFVDLLRKRPELQYLWTQLQSNKELYVPSEGSPPRPYNFDNLSPELDGFISIQSFTDFLVKHQRQKGSDGYLITLNEVELRLKQAVAQMGGIGTEHFDGKRVTWGVFRAYMKSSFNYIFDEMNYGKEYQDMDQPLSSYYIASSHNTYLEGDQLASSSSTQRYISDLLEGCRCVELDVWNGNNKDPIITHGHTACSTITFRDAIMAINEYGFVNSPYPIILSIEQHCNLEQQGVQADIMKAIFKDKLAPRITNPDASGCLLPSPNELRYKILLKGKREDAVDDEGDDSEDDDDNDPDMAAAKAAAKSVRSMKNNAKRNHVAKEMSDLIYLGTGKVKVFDEKSRDLPCDMMCSYSESTTSKHLTSKDQSVVNRWSQHNREHLSRIYPKGIRVDSSNYAPAPAWSAGNQLVALNYQTGDLGMFVNRSKFQDNGRCGYLLKPEYLRDDSADQDDPVDLYVHVLGGGSLPKPGGAKSGEIIDPFVVVHLDGNPLDKAHRKTKVINNNGFDPMFNEVFKFHVSQPSQAVLTFEVRDDDTMGSDFIAQGSCPLVCAQQGVRKVTLADRDGTITGPFQFASLFVDIRIEHGF